MAEKDDYSDLAELGIDLDEEDELTTKFIKCSKHIQSIAGSLDNDTLLKLYGLYKQSNEGPCNVPKPSWYDMKGKAKWEAWKSLGSLDRNEAKKSYIDLVLTLSPQFSFDDAKSKRDCWVSVSALVQDPAPLEMDIHDHIRNGDLAKVKSFIEMNQKSKNELDCEGMGLIHYTSDVGQLKVLELLINQGCDVNLQDGDGQTALHYASSCGHLNCITLLLAKGAQVDLKDKEGNTPEDVAADETVRQLLN